MDLPSTFGSARICWLGGRTFWVRPLSIDGVCTLLGWLDDTIPGREERTKPPPLNGDESKTALVGRDGQTLLAWLAVRDTGLNYDDVAAIEFSESEISRIHRVLFARRRTLKQEGSGNDIAETECGEGMAQMAIAIGMKELASLTMDQFEWLNSDGKCDGGGDYSPEDIVAIQAKFLAERAAIANGVPNV